MFNSNNKEGERFYICLYNAFSIVSTEETSAGSSLQVVHWFGGRICDEVM